MDWTRSALRTITDGYVVGEYYVRLSQGMLYKKIGDDWYYAEDRSNPQECKDPLVSLITCLDAVRRDTE